MVASSHTTHLPGLRSRYHQSLIRTSPTLSAAHRGCLVLHVIRVLILSIPCGWLLAALGFILFLELEDTTIAFDAPHLKVTLTPHK